MNERTRTVERMIYVRAVNGDGPPCEKCGKRSALHVGKGDVRDPEVSFFLCRYCAFSAVEREVMAKERTPG